MGQGFFDATRPGEKVRHGTTEFELPILYFRDDAFAAFFTADAARIRERMPTPDLFPVTLPGGRALVAVAAFNYVETSIGPYGEVAVAVPAVLGRRPVSPLPALREARTPGFGLVILHLPVTTAVARDAGRAVWGYAKFLSDMTFTITPERLSCRLEEGGRHILTLEVPRAGTPVRDPRPLVTYSVLDGKLIRTVIRERALFVLHMLGLAAIAVGNARGALELAARYARERYQGGTEIAGHPAVQLLLGDAAVRIRTASGRLAAASASAARGELDVMEAAAVKLAVCELCRDGASDALQVLGGYGYMEDYRLEKRLRDALTLVSLRPAGDEIRLAVGGRLGEESP